MPRHDAKRSRQAIERSRQCRGTMRNTVNNATAQHMPMPRHKNKPRDLKKNAAARRANHQNEERQRKALLPNLGAKDNAAEQRVMPRHEE